MWISFNWERATMTSEGGTLLASLNAAALALTPFTIIRTRMNIHVISDQAAANELQFGAVGAAVVSLQASAIGVTAVPTPVTDMGSDLFFVHQNYVGAGFGTGVAAPGRIEGQFLTVDSKAMRKVNDDQDLVLVTEFDSEGGGQIVSVAARFLLKLH